MLKRRRKVSTGISIPVTQISEQSVTATIQVNNPPPKPSIGEKLRSGITQGFTRVVEGLNSLLEVDEETLQRWEEERLARKIDAAQQKKTQFLEQVCFVYLMKETGKGYYKIGISKNPERRRSELERSSPHEVHLLHLIVCEDRSSSMRLESEFHQRFSHRSISNEWFVLDLIDVRHICEIDSFGTEMFRATLRELRDKHEIKW
ncbi:MAG: GIY-YIG nuclease family protein [Anaerolineales bacterium]|nr:GIY-YIG nuclease family protein [Anaerolineales bacterium]